jgi:hypothetical protein
MKLTDVFTEAVKDAEKLIQQHDSPLATGESIESRAVFLRAALVLMMAAVDKILHEAISNHFATLVRTEQLDKLVQIELSRAYQIAQAARKRTGKGGKVKRRPGHDIKAEVLAKIYRDSYLSIRRLNDVCAACDKNGIFSRYAEHRKKLGKKTRSPKWLQDRWSRINQRRNQIAHECDIKRQAKMRKAHFNAVDGPDFKRDITFVKNFGTFLAAELD